MMKKNYFLIFILVFSFVLQQGCGRSWRKHHHYFPSLEWSTLKLMSFINAVDQHFDPGLHEHVVLRPQQMLHGTDRDHHSWWGNWTWRKPLKFGGGVRYHHAYSNVIEIFGPDIEKQVTVSCCSNVLGINTGIPLKYSPFQYVYTPNPLNLLYSILSGGSIYYQNVYYPGSIGFGDPARGVKSAPLSLGYFPGGEFMGLIPGYTVTHQGLNHILRLVELVNGQQQPLNDLSQRIRVFGGPDHTKGNLGVLSGFIEDEEGVFRFGKFTIYNIHAAESEAEYEIYQTPIKL